MRKPKINFNTSNLKSNKFISLIILSFISALFIVLFFVSLPRTESVIPYARFDLLTKDADYWKKEYVLELEIKKQDKDQKDEKVERTKDVLYKRLANYGVEEISVVNISKPKDLPEDQDVSELELDVETETQDSEVTGEEASTDTKSNKEDDNLKEYIKVTVQSSKDKLLVDQIIKSRHYLRIVTRKEDVNFEDPENQIAMYLEENYDDTDFTRYSFRNIYITKAKNNYGESSYFAFFKTWPFSASDFNNFVDDNAGQVIGISNDGFVQPVLVPSDSRNQFSIEVASTYEDAQVQDILYNSGVIPVNYSVVQEKEFEPLLYDIDYMQLALAMVVGLVVIIGYLYTRRKKDEIDVINLGLTLVVSYSVWIAGLKILGTPVDLFLVVLEALLLLVFVKILTIRTNEGKFIKVSVIIITGLLSYVLNGYSQIFMRHMFFLSILVSLLDIFIDYYLDNMKKILTR